MSTTSYILAILIFGSFWLCQHYTGSTQATQTAQSLGSTPLVPAQNRTNPSLEGPAETAGEYHSLTPFCRRDFRPSSHHGGERSSWMEMQRLLENAQLCGRVLPRLRRTLASHDGSVIVHQSVQKEAEGKSLRWMGRLERGCSMGQKPTSSRAFSEPEETPPQRPTQGERPSARQRKGEGKGQDQTEIRRCSLAPTSHESGRSGSPQTPAASAAEQELRSLVAALKKTDMNSLPDEVKNLVTASSKNQSQQACNALHAAVRKLGSAKKGLQLAREARVNLYKSWQKYLAETIDKWKGYAEDFATSDAKLVQNWETAVETLKTAKQELEQAQANATGKSEDVASDISDEDLEAPAAAAQLNEDIHMLISNLDSMKQKATDAATSWWKSISLAGAFWQAPFIDRKEVKDGLIGRQDHAQVHGCEATHAPSLKWTHSIIRECGFLSEWKAIGEAQDLAWEVHHGSPPDVTPAIALATSNPKSAWKGMRERTVGFADNVDIAFYTCESKRFCSTTLRHAELLDWSWKPWTLPTWDRRQPDREQHAGEEADFTSLLAHIPHREPRDTTLLQHPPRLPDLPPGAHAEDQLREDDDPDSDNDMPIGRTWQSVHIFWFGHEVHETRVPWDSFEDMHYDICRRLNIPQRELMAIYEVANGPSDLSDADITPLLLHRSGDLYTGDLHQLALVDIQRHGSWPSLTTDVTRSLHALPRELCRDALLRYLGVEPYCRRMRSRCLVWHNNVLLAHQQRGHVRIKHGDYLKVAVPPFEDACEVPTRQAIAFAAAGVPSRQFRQRFRQESFLNGRFDPHNRQRMDSANYDIEDHGLLQIDKGVQTFKIGENDEIAGGEAVRLCQENPLEFRPDEELPQPFSPVLSEDDSLEDEADSEVQSPSEEEVAMTTFRTWFVRGPNYVQCDISRTIRPRSLQAFHIELAIRQTWDDMVDPNMPVQFYAVHPSPLTGLEETRMPHLIATQNVPIGMTATLRTVVFNDNMEAQFAILDTDEVSHYDLVVAARQEGRCYTDHLNHECRSSFGANEISTSAFFKTDHGFSLVTEIQEKTILVPQLPPEPISVFWPEDDAIGPPIALAQAHRLAREAHRRRPILPIHTWFINHQGPLRCHRSRLAILGPDPTTWVATVRQIWRELSLQFHRVQPHPAHHDQLPRVEHIIVSQSDILFPDRRGVFISVNKGAEPYNVVASIFLPTTPENIIWYADGYTFCGPGHADWNCAVRRKGIFLISGQQEYLANGERVDIEAEPWQNAGPPVSTQDQATQTDFLGTEDIEEEACMLQTSSGRQIGDAVAQAPQPEPCCRRTLCLEHLLRDIPREEQNAINSRMTGPEGTFIAHVLAPQISTPLPSWIEVKDLTVPVVRTALASWGYTGLFAPLLHWPVILCFPARTEPTWSKLFVYVPIEDFELENIVIKELGSSGKVSEIKHMKILFENGFNRATIIEDIQVTDNVHVIAYHNNIPEIETTALDPKKTYKWPDPLAKRTTLGTLFSPPEPQTDAPESHIVVKTPFNTQDLCDLFCSADGILCQEWQHLDLPLDTRKFLEQCKTSTDPDDLTPFDRIVIHTDGSSKPANRHRSALWNEDQDACDTWAMIIVGENYHAGLPSTFTFLGWSSQRVVVEEHQTHFTGADRVGADIAEQEGILWASLWRLAHQALTPTTFVCDNLSVLGQAQGTVGSTPMSSLVRSLRGTMQCLQNGLGEEGISFHHTYGHVGDPLNEFVDWAAKRERTLTVRHDVLQQKNLHIVTRFHEDIHTYLIEEAYNIPVLDQEPAEPAQAIFACMQCAKKFRTKAGQGAHLFKVHGVIAECRRYFDKTACGACLQEFHTAKKLKAHLRYSQQCMRILRGRRALCDHIPGDGSRADTILQHQHDGLQPTQQGHGPRLPDGRLLDEDPVHWELHGALQEALIDCDTAEAVFDTFLHLIQQYVVTWDGLKETLHHLQAHYTEEDAEINHLAPVHLEQACRRLVDPATWAFLTEAADPQTDRALWNFEEAFAKVCTRDNGLHSANSQIPRPVGIFRYVLHAYSGRRRYGDIQYFLDKLNHPEVCIQVLSVDVIIDPHFGDLTSDQVQSLWLRAIRSHYIIALLAGPPCNTWSRVRKQQLGTNERGPRPLRDVTHPWALPSLGLGELDQILAGNNLLIFAFKALYALLCAGGAGLVEHPDEADLDDVSIWRLPIIAALRRHPEVTLHHVTQGFHGSEGLKPTGLMALRLHGLESDLQEWKLSNWHVQGVNVGKNSQGTYNTARLKEYPPAFCGSVAATFFRALSQRPIDRSAQCPVEFTEFCQKFAWLSVCIQVLHTCRLSSSPSGRSRLT
eukprot:Skav201901  [mRNA]  locus=scaffold550:1015895:1030873:- [translate_table: standard]